MDDFQRFVQEFVDKTKELTGAAKIHADIKNEELKIQRKYYELGKKYYELYKDAPEQAMKEYVEFIDDCNAKIWDCREKLNEMKDQDNI